MLNSNKINLHQLTIKFNMVSEQVLKMTVAQLKEAGTFIKFLKWRNGGIRSLRFLRF